MTLEAVQASSTKERDYERSLSDKVVIVTGAGCGIGCEIALSVPQRVPKLS
jgi:FlaA1/EpsC-like NDP-sugar epimerase